jgi:hypothetical protein
MQQVIEFVNTIINGIRDIITFMGSGVEYVGVIVGTLPAVVLVPIGICITILVIYVIIGRGS